MFRIQFSNGQAIFVNATDSQAAWRLASQYAASNGLDPQFNIGTVNANNGPQQDDVVIGTPVQDRQPAPGEIPFLQTGSTPGEVGGAIDPGAVPDAPPSVPVPDNGETDSSANSGQVQAPTNSQGGGDGQTRFWNVRIPGAGGIYVQAQTYEDAMIAGGLFAEQNGIDTSGGMDAGEVSGENYRTGLQVGLDGSAVGNVSGSWLETYEPPARPTDGAPGAGGPGIGAGDNSDTDGGLPGNDGSVSGSTGNGSPAAGPAGTPTPTANPNAIPFTADDVSTLGVFRNMLDREGGPGANSVIGGVAQQNLFNPLFGTFALRALANLGGSEAPRSENDRVLTDDEAILGAFGEGAPSFGQFLGQQGVDYGGTALDALRAVANPGFGQDANTVGQLLRGARSGSQLGGVAENATLMALRSLLSPSVANLFGNQLINQASNDYESRIAAQAGGANDAGDYVTFLLNNVLGG